MLPTILRELLVIQEWFAVKETRVPVACWRNFSFVFPHEEDLFWEFRIIDSRWQTYQCRILRPEG